MRKFNSSEFVSYYHLGEFSILFTNSLFNEKKMSMPENKIYLVGKSGRNGIK